MHTPTNLSTSAAQSALGGPLVSDPRWPRSGIGIDIGQYSTKVVQARRGKQGIEYASVVLPLTLVQPEPDTPPRPAVDPIAPCPPAQPSKRRADRGPLVDWSRPKLDLIAGAVRDALGREAHRQPISLCVSMSACQLRSLYLGGKDGRNDVHEQLRQLTGNDQPRCMALLPGKTADNKQRVLSIPEKLAVDIGDAFHAFGLTPRRLDALPWCLARLAAASPPRPANAAAAAEAGPPAAGPPAAGPPAGASGQPNLQIVLDWSFGQPTLISVLDGQIDYVRQIPEGGLSDLIRQSMVDLEMPAQEALRWMQHCLRADSRASNPAIADTLQWFRECCHGLAAEIQLALEFIRWRNQAGIIHGILLTGGAAIQPELVECLQSALDVPLRPWTKGELSADLAVASTLALEGMHHAK